MVQLRWTPFYVRIDGMNNHEPRTTTLRRSRKASVPSVKMAEAVEEWHMSLRAANRSPHTITGYGKSVDLFDRFLVDTGRSTLVDAITANDVRAFLTSILADRAATTALTRWSGLLAFFKWATAQGFTIANPMIDIERPQINVKVIPSIPQQDIKSLLESCDRKTFRGIRDYAIMRLLLCGMRRGEIASLDVGAIDWKQLTILVHGKGNKERRVMIKDKDGLALKAYMRQRSAYIETRPTHHAAYGSEALFVGKHGRLSGSGIEHMLNARCNALGIDRANAHAWRHTWAGAWKENGGSDEGLMEQGGWSNSKMIGRYTAHNRSISARKEAARLNIGGDL